MNKPDAGPSELDRQTIDTRLGPIEYACQGEGTPVVVLHGSSGGIDAAALMAGAPSQGRSSGSSHT